MQYHVRFEGGALKKVTLPLSLMATMLNKQVGEMLSSIEAVAVSLSLAIMLGLGCHYEI